MSTDRPGPEPAGDADAVDHALGRARAAARRRGTPEAGGRSHSRTRRRARSDRQPERSGPGPSERDPQTLGALVGTFAADHGWQTDLAVGSIAGRWADLVGRDVAEHCRPEHFDNGELVLVAESTAWATQLRLLAPTLLGRIGAAVGPGLVHRLVIHGPAGPSWRKGRWRVAGRGPRDTYG